MQSRLILENLSCLINESCPKDMMMACQKVNFTLNKKPFIVSTTTKQLILLSIVQPGYAVYRNLKQLLLKACQGKDVTSELEHVCSVYKDDFQSELLHAQLITFGIEFQHVQKDTYRDHSTKAPTIFESFTSLTGAQRSLLAMLLSSSWSCQQPMLRQKNLVVLFIE